MSNTTENNQNQSTVNELSVPQILKKALADAEFQNTDIGGKMFSLLDSLHSDFVEIGIENENLSETTVEYAQELIDMLAEDLNNLASEPEEEEEEVEEEEEEDILSHEDEDEEEEEDDDEDDAVSQSIIEGDLDEDSEEVERSGG